MPSTIDDVSLANVVVVRDTEEQVSVVTDERLVLVDAGTQGPPGADGKDGSSYVAFSVNISAPAVSHLIRHDLGRYPAVVVVDSAGDVLEPYVKYPSINEVLLEATMPFSGTVSLV